MPPGQWLVAAGAEDLLPQLAGTLPALAHRPLCGLPLVLGHLPACCPSASPQFFNRPWSSLPHPRRVNVPRWACVPISFGLMSLWPLVSLVLKLPSHTAQAGGGYPGASAQLQGKGRLRQSPCPHVKLLTEE